LGSDGLERHRGDFDGMSVGGAALEQIGQRWESNPGQARRRQIGLMT